MMPPILWYLLALVLTGGILFQLRRDCRPYLLGGQVRLAPQTVAGSEFLFGFWIVLILFLFVPNLLAIVLEWVPDYWNPWLAQTLLQLVLAISLILLFRNKFASWDLLRRSPNLQGKLFPISFLWFLIALVIFIAVHTLWRNVMISLGAEDKLQEALVESVTSQDPAILMLLFVSVVILAPIWEELLFRGLLFRFLYGKAGFWVAALISGFLFSILHALPTGIGGLWALGILFALAYRITEDIRVPILIHALYNLNTLIIGRMFLDPSQLEEVMASFLCW